LGADTAAARPIAIANFLLQSGSFKKKKLKMVADHQICISVLEGAFVSHLCNAFGDFNDQILLWVVKTTTMVAHRLIMTFRTLPARAAATKPNLSA